MGARNHDHTISKWQPHRHQMPRRITNRSTRHLHKPRKTAVPHKTDENGHGNEHWLCLVRVMHRLVMWKKKRAFRGGGGCSARSFQVNKRFPSSRYLSIVSAQ